MAGSRWTTQVTLMPFWAGLLVFFATATSTPQVPLLMWSTESLSPVASPAGHITSIDQFSAYISSALGSGPHTVLLFLQNKLSRDDFTVYGGVFGNKQDSAFQNLEVCFYSHLIGLILSFWTGSSAVLALLQEKLGASSVLTDAETLSHLSIDTFISNLLLINLPYCTGLEKSCKEVLHHNDEIIGKVLSIMKAKNVPYTAVYTGLQPSRVIAESTLSNSPMGRSLLQTAAPSVKPPIVFNNDSGTPCILLWAQNLNVSFKDTEWTDLNSQTPSLTGSMCNGSFSLLVLNYENGTSLSFSLSRRFYPVSARDWFTLDSVQLQFNGSVATYIGSRNIYAPAEYSFHCQSVSSFRDPLLVPNDTDITLKDWKLNFVDFQIQGFTLTNGTNFSYASDCAGFFTPGIWMGLLTSLLMLLIFVYGLHMIMHLNTMDRFDDPKGPSISVPQSE
uniref:V-type proton ATPase subunit S1-like n=1 Tax=Sphaeramia orbicularis TaxID=375764 RepID=A0A672YPA0_9TELE